MSSLKSAVAELSSLGNVERLTFRATLNHLQTVNARKVLPYLLAEFAEADATGALSVGVIDPETLFLGLINSVPVDKSKPLDKIKGLQEAVDAIFVAKREETPGVPGEASTRKTKKKPAKK